MSLGLFEAAAGSSAEEEKRKSLVKERFSQTLSSVEEKVSDFLLSAETNEELAERIDLVRPDVQRVASRYFSNPEAAVEPVIKSLSRKYKGRLRRRKA